jgi:UDP-4-amino-4,6-dideoxy-N-acetyl-beta-L-altrosamine transaminase
MISYGKQTISESDLKAVADALTSDFLTQGPKSKTFEQDLCHKFGANYCSVLANGTGGLHLIALALGWGKGDIIITTPITFLASANCAIYAGATPDFCDIDSVSYTIDLNKLEEKIKQYKTSGKKIKAVVAVDFAGHPCNWEELRIMANEYDFQLVNDFCHALGAEYKGDLTYASKYADAVNLSFHPVKHITTGEGGAVLTNDPAIDQKIKSLRTHGMIREEQLLEEPTHGPWYYEMQEVGFNYRITDFQCALGISQLKKLDEFLVLRRAIAQLYDDAFHHDERFIIPFVHPDTKHAYHLYPLQILFDKTGFSKKDFFNDFRQKGIFFQVHYIPVHLQPYYRKNYGFKNGDFPVSEQFYSREVSIPIYPLLKIEEAKYVVAEIKEYLTK